MARKIRKQCDLFKLIKAENYFVINKHKTDQTAIAWKSIDRDRQSLAWLSYKFFLAFVFLMY